MKERPILFNTEMVKSILDGRKTQSRRPVKPIHKEACGFNVNFDYKGEKVMSVTDFDEDEFSYDHNMDTPSPFGQIGDHLYVRETFLIGEIEEGFDTPHENEYLIHNDIHGKPIYYADHIDFKNLNNIIRSKDWDDCKWKPSIHMPKKYARIWLEITDIRVERVQGITGSQSLKEGVKIPDKVGCPDLDPSWPDMFGEPRGPVSCVLYPQCSCGSTLARAEFKKTWDSIYNNWSDNPWVWVIEFKRIEHA